MKRLQQTYPDATVEIWAEDEHRIGLQPMTRKVWVEALEVPRAQVNWKREWLWLYAFVQPQTGETKRVAFTFCQYSTVSAGT